MSSVRISHHNRSAATPPSAAGESGRSEAPPGGASFAVALGAAGLLQKGFGAALFGAKANDAADGAASRKRVTGDAKADAAAVLAAQGSLLAAAAGQAAEPLHDAADASAAPVIVADGDLKSAVLSGAEQAAADAGSSAAATLDGPASGSPHPSLTAAVATLRDAEGELASVLNADGSTPGSTPADAAVVLSTNLAPEPLLAPNSNLALAVPVALSGLAQGQTPVAEGQPGAGSGDATSGGEGRGRFVTATASESSRATEAAALGATGELPAAASTPTAAASPATIMDTSAAATISDQVASHVSQLIASGSREMVMRLHPPELGEVTVRVAVNGRDVSAWFGSPQPQVQTAIADGLGQLQAGLDNAGYNLSGAWVGADASGARQQAGALPLSAGAAPVIDTGMSAASRPSASGLNIYV
jgi:flagellar hook-length control protein FliK